MAMQTGVSTSKVLILVGAGLTGSVILRSGRLSDVILQLQELLKGVNEVEISANKYDSVLLAAQGWSISDVMFVTKHNMENAVVTVSKQLENVTETLASTKRHLTRRLENLDWKLERQKETSELIANDVKEVKSNLCQIGFDVEIIHQMVSGLEGKIELLQSKQDMTNSGLWYLCQLGGGIKDGPNAKIYQDISHKLVDNSKVTQEERSLKGLQFIVENSKAKEKPMIGLKGNDLDANPVKVVSMKTRVDRTYNVGISLSRDITGSYL
ncbi:uncharacterized protein LOC131149150 isoform X3 [Malania oleifera]|uniref:uncharacterized protein LOC131149150 isoform X3 n=1 Tax=Malania oleifera TaxID=397392 RepID=UPI0025ADAAEF|nr:uncharacterized protein LOC131149150 isoform X3 [Malania oleifera]